MTVLVKNRAAIFTALVSGRDYIHAGTAETPKRSYKKLASIHNEGSSRTCSDAIPVVHEAIEVVSL